MPIPMLPQAPLLHALDLHDDTILNNHSHFTIANAGYRVLHLVKVELVARARADDLPFVTTGMSLVGHDLPFDSR
jgi:hypothetical protein